MYFVVADFVDLMILLVLRVVVSCVLSVSLALFLSQRIWEEKINSYNILLPLHNFPNKNITINFPFGCCYYLFIQICAISARAWITHTILIHSIHQTLYLIWRHIPVRSIGFNDIQFSNEIKSIMIPIYTDIPHSNSGLNCGVFWF